MNEKEENAKILTFLESERKSRQEQQQSTADVAERVQKKLRVHVTHEKNKYPILEESLVHHKPNENICAHGVAPKEKKELHVEER